MKFFSSFLTMMMIVTGFAFTAMASTEEDYLALSEMAEHTFPAHYTFETDKDVTYTSELLGQVEDAFIISANKAHNDKKMVFERDQIYLIDHGRTKKHSYVENFALGNGDAPATNLRRRRTWDWWWIINKGKILKWYMALDSHVTIACNMCKNDDDDAMMMMMTTEEDSETFMSNMFQPNFYELEKGKSILKTWEKEFCDLLGKIKEFNKVKDCKIEVDFKHEVPAGSMLSLSNKLEQ